MTTHTAQVLKEVAIAIASPFVALLAVEYLRRAWRLWRADHDRRQPFRGVVIRIRTGRRVRPVVIPFPHRKDSAA